jgi:hypothetical protein
LLQYLKQPSPLLQLDLLPPSPLLQLDLLPPSPLLQLDLLQLDLPQPLLQLQRMLHYKLVLVLVPALEQVLA